MKQETKIFLASTVIVLLFSCAMNASAFCFEEAGQMYNISPHLLWSIAKVESDFRPKAVNWNKNGSYDYGVMQINSGWRRTLGDGIWNSLGDPCMNVKVGAWVLAQCIAKHGYTWKAVGCYNATSQSKRDTYARKVYGTLIRYTHYNSHPQKTKTLIAQGDIASSALTAVGGQ
jgi:soluble lytic murein transglycosylase-like protein